VTITPERYEGQRVESGAVLTGGFGILAALFDVYGILFPFLGESRENTKMFISDSPLL
jgi:hypothetical protein